MNKYHLSHSGFIKQCFVREFQFLVAKGKESVAYIVAMSAFLSELKKKRAATEQIRVVPDPIIIILHQMCWIAGGQ